MSLAHSLHLSSKVLYFYIVYVPFVCSQRWINSYTTGAREIYRPGYASAITIYTIHICRTKIYGGECLLWAFFRQHYFYFCRHLFHQMYIRGFNNTQRQLDSILSQTVLHFICDIVFRFVSLRFNIFLWKCFFCHCFFISCFFCPLRFNDFFLSSVQSQQSESVVCFCFWIQYICRNIELLVNHIIYIHRHTHIYGKQMAKITDQRDKKWARDKKTSSGSNNKIKTRRNKKER